MVKRCARCFKSKSIKLFYRNRSRKDGRDEYCKRCRDAYYTKKRKTDPAYNDTVRAAQRRYLERNPDRPRAIPKDSWDKLTPEQQEQQRRGYYLWKHYRMTVEQYDQMLQEQEGRCAICDEEMSPVHVDHNHTTSEVRALLCSGCNRGLGCFRENKAYLANAIHYLEMYGAETTADP